MVDQKLLSVREAAEALGLGVTFLYSLLGSGRLRSLKVGRRRLIPAEALDAFIADREAEQS